MTGEQIEAEIFIGPTYYMRLKHMVKDKINYRALGPRTALTRQPVSGRANDGGLRIGEMERDGLISHGMTNFLNESMMERGDKYYMAICNTTGMIAIYNPAKNLFMSPMADGPIKFTGSLVGNNMNIENITKYGRSFSVVCVPYSLKLFIHELQTMNIHMRIITDDNIDQIENMMFSKNMDRLTGFENTTLLQYNRFIDEKLRGSKGIKEPEDEFKEEIIPPVPLKENVEKYTPYDAKEFVDSPEYNIESPEYAPYNISPLEVESLDREPEYMKYIKSPNSEREEEINIKNEEEYQLGDEVGYRGGDIKPRKWKIKHKGAKFATIVTDDTEGIIDNLLVVPYNYIFPYHENKFSIQDNPFATAAAIQSAATANAVEQIPAIKTDPRSLMPSINIVVGDNNKLQGNTEVEETKKRGGGDIGSDNVGGYAAESNNTIGQNDSQSKISVANNTSNEKSENGVIDFSKGNFLIKKTG
jgi:hypothetical protein